MTEDPKELKEAMDRMAKRVDELQEEMNPLFEIVAKDPTDLRSGAIARILDKIMTPEMKKQVVLISMEKWLKDLFYGSAASTLGIDWVDEKPKLKLEE